MNGAATKQCSQCRRVLPLDWHHYGKNKRSSFGFESACKECKRPGGKRRGPRGDMAARFWFYVAKSDGCWLWNGGRTRLGYGIFKSGIGTTVAHRASWALEHGSLPPDGVEVCHRCDTPACVNPAHLFLGTHKDNMRDMSAKGRTGKHDQRGELNAKCRLTDEAVARMIALRDAGTSGSDLAALFGVSCQYVYAVCNGRVRRPDGIVLRRR